MIPEQGFGLSLIPGPETTASCTILETWPHTCVIEAGRLRRRRRRKDGRGTKRPNFQAQWAKGFFLLPAAAFSKTLYCGEEEEEEEVKAIPGEEVRGKEEEEERIWKKGGYGAALSSSFRTSPP